MAKSMLLLEVGSALEMRRGGEHYWIASINWTIVSTLTRHAERLTTSPNSLLHSPTVNLLHLQFLAIHEGVVRHAEHVDTVEILEIVVHFVFHVIRLRITISSHYCLSVPNEENTGPLGGGLALHVENDAVRLGVDALHDLHQRLHQRVKNGLVEHFAQHLEGVGIHQTAIPNLYTDSPIQQIGANLRLQGVFEEGKNVILVPSMVFFVTLLQFRDNFRLYLPHSL